MGGSGAVTSAAVGSPSRGLVLGLVKLLGPLQGYSVVPYSVPLQTDPRGTRHAVATARATDSIPCATQRRTKEQDYGKLRARAILRHPIRTADGRT